MRFTGGIGAVGVYVPQDPGGADDLAKQGEVAFDYGLHWFKGQTMGSGQCPVKNRLLPRDLVAGAKAKPSWIVSHDLPLDQAPEAYQHFDSRDDVATHVMPLDQGPQGYQRFKDKQDGCVFAVFQPNGASSSTS